MADYGITEQTQSADNLIIESELALALPLDSSVGTASRGQALVYDTTGHNYVKFTAFSVSAVPAVLLEDVALTGDGVANCLVCGTVNLNSLDATAKADVDVIAARTLGGNIFVLPAQAVE